MKNNEVMMYLKKRIDTLEKDWNKAVLNGSSKSVIDYIEGRWHEAETILLQIQSM